MGSTANKLHYLIATKSAIRNAIRARGVNVSSDDTFRSYADKIGEIQTGSGDGEVVVVDSGIIRFFDYDGTILHAYNKEEVAAMTEMPPLPTQVGLICQRWNYDLDTVKHMAATYGRCDVGATYITDDGHTRLYMSIGAEGRLTIPLLFTQTVSNGVTIDWGDWSEKETYDGTGIISASHTYGAEGDYIISFEVADGCSLYFGRGSVDYNIFGKDELVNRMYCYMLTRVEIGRNVGRLGIKSFSGCNNLKYATIPNNVKLDDYCFANAGLVALVVPYGSASLGINALVYTRALRHVIISPTVTRIDESALSSTYALRGLIIPESVKTIVRHAVNGARSMDYIVMPPSASIGEYAFANCYSLRAIKLPSNLSTIPQYVFLNCYSLEEIEIPSGVTTISQYAFENCYNLERVILYEGLTTIQQYAFHSCNALREINLPSSLTSLGQYAFQTCTSLKDINIPYGVTSYSAGLLYSTVITSFNIREGITTIPTAFLAGCYGLTSLVFPKSVTNINASAFASCYGMGIYDFSQLEAVPTLANVNAFLNIQPDCRIIVPYQLYEEWKTASNWSHFASHIEMNYTPTECISLEITADDVLHGNLNTSKVHWTAVTNGVLRDGTMAENVTLSGTVEVNVGYNRTADAIEKEVSYTYLGMTATAVISQGAYLENCLVCKFRATTETSATTLMYSSFSNYSTYFSSMIVDGEEKAIARTYTFPTRGEHIVVFKVKEGASITTPYRMFYNCTALTYADCTEMDLKAATSTGTSAGTAQMFYGCTNLKTIIFGEPYFFGYYMFYNCPNVETLIIKDATAPSLYGSSTWGGSSSYIGYSKRNAGTNKLYVPTGATGYDAGSWTSTLRSATYCGFTKVESDEL